MVRNGAILRYGMCVFTTFCKGEGEGEGEAFATGRASPSGKWGKNRVRGDGCPLLDDAAVAYDAACTWRRASLQIRPLGVNVGAI